MSSTDYHAAALESRDSAMKDVANHLNKPESLDRLDQYKRKIMRKKATIESQLRNAVQTQLDGVQKGLHTLQDLEKTVSEVKSSMGDVERLYQDCAELSDVVKPIKEVNRKHRQLKTTTIHLNNIFNVPTVVKETHELIQQDKLLEAHRNLAELEHTRDELFIQLYQSEDAFVDKNTSLHHYFEPLTGLSDALGQQLWLIMNQVTALVTSVPSRVVTAMRIIEREEKTDAIIKEALSARGIPTAQLPGRPKKWQEKCFQILETSISNRFAEMQPSEDEKLENSGWLQEHLRNVAGFSYSDLDAMKQKGASCFPPSYKILTFFIKCHHSCLVKEIAKLVSDDPNARDIIPLMIWIGDVRDSFHEMLEIDFLSYGRLIDPDTEANLQGRCQKQVENNVQGLVAKMVDTEKEDMNAHQPPETDINGHYYTSLGITLFQMVDQNISALTPLGIANKLKILSICLGAITQFQRLYREALADYHRAHLECQRKSPPFYINYIIAAANNCRGCIDFADQLRERFLTELAQRSLNADHEKIFKVISEEFDSLAHFCCDSLLETVFIDFEKIFSDLFKRDAWLAQPGNLIGNAEATLFDYDNDFKFLKKAYHSYVIIAAQHKFMSVYLQAMLSKRMVFKKDKEREKAAGMIREEAAKMSNFFLRLSHATNPKYTAVLEEMAVLLSAKQDYLAMDITALGKKHPYVRSNHVIALLAMRGDLNRSLVQKIMQQTNLVEQQPEDLRSTASASPTGLMSSAMKKKQDEKLLFQEAQIPNPYNMVGR